jgi:hypothetical protein
MALRWFRRKDKSAQQTPAEGDGGSKAVEAPATGAGGDVPESARPQATKARRASEAGKGGKPAPKPARKTGQPSKPAAKRGASGKATKPKKGAR